MSNNIQPNGAGYRPEIEDVPYGYDDEQEKKKSFLNNFLAYTAKCSRDEDEYFGIVDTVEEEQLK